MQPGRQHAAALAAERRDQQRDGLGAAPSVLLRRHERRLRPAHAAAAAEQPHQRGATRAASGGPTRLGFWMMSICANEGHSCAACATSPHSPQPTQSLLTWAIGIGAQRILARLDGERGAARQADAGMVAGAHLRIDPEARAHHALAGRHRLRHLRA